MHKLGVFKDIRIDYFMSRDFKFIGYTWSPCKGNPKCRLKAFLPTVSSSVLYTDSFWLILCFHGCEYLFQGKMHHITILSARNFFVRHKLHVLSFSPHIQYNSLFNFFQMFGICSIFSFYHCWYNWFFLRELVLSIKKTCFRRVFLRMWR